MRKTAFFSMCGALVMALALAGCATSGGGSTAAKGPSAEEGIKASLEGWKAGMEGKDLAKLGASMSDKFNHSEWGNKQQMLDFLKSQFDQGTLDGTKVDGSKAKITVNGNTATVYPVEMTASFGTATIEFKLEKEADGVWRATGINVEGV